MNIRDMYKNYVQTPQGKQLDDFRDGGLVKGKAHAQGGVPTYQVGGEMPMGEPEQIAEVEGAGVSEDGIAVNGGERIFSVEDTTQMEQMAQQFMESQDESILTQLGMFVVESIMRQEQASSEQDPAMAQGMEGQDMGGMPMEQPMMKRGGRLGLGFDAVELDY